MNSLGDIFAELGISHYLHDFIEQGFDTWDTILDIKESDFDALGVKLGHRRKLQRRIASFRGLSSDRALDSPGHVPTEEFPLDEHKTSGTKPDNKDGGSSSGLQGAKRKYRRHPKQDENAPDRPPSAYVIFSNKMREDLKGRNLSFTEIAKLVGEHWQSLAPSDKEPFEQQAFTAKEKYNAELAEYKKTENYRDYTQYLAEFKARQSNQQPVNDLEISKRPKLEGRLSATSTGTTSSGASMHGVETSRSSRAGSSSNPNQWQAGDEQTPLSSSMSKSSTSFSPPKLRGSPSTPSTTALPGYRESLYGNAQQSLPWRDGPREEGAASLQQFSRMASVGDQRPTYMLMGIGDSRNASDLAQHSHRTGHSRVPPPLSSETTSMSTTSTGSTSSYFTPQTPVELPSERGLPLPSLYSQHSSGSYENVLPPLRPPSLSPQTTMLGSQHSPTTMYSKMDFPSTIAPLRGYGPASQASHPDIRPREAAKMPSKPTDEDLDPVSALLKAGEIVNRSSQGR